MLNTEIISVINDEITRMGHDYHNVLDHTDRVKYIDVYHADVCVAYYRIIPDGTIILTEHVTPSYNAQERRYSLSQPNVVSLLVRQIHEWAQTRLLKDRNVPK